MHAYATNSMLAGRPTTAAAAAAATEKGQQRTFNLGGNADVSPLIEYYSRVEDELTCFGKDPIASAFCQEILLATYY